MSTTLLTSSGVLFCQTESNLSEPNIMHQGDDKLNNMLDIYIRPDFMDPNMKLEPGTYCLSGLQVSGSLQTGISIYNTPTFQKDPSFGYSCVLSAGYACMFTEKINIITEIGLGSQNISGTPSILFQTNLGFNILLYKKRGLLLDLGFRMQRGSLSGYASLGYSYQFNNAIRASISLLFDTVSNSKAKASLLQYTLRSDGLRDLDIIDKDVPFKKITLTQDQLSQIAISKLEEIIAGSITDNTTKIDIMVPKPNFLALSFKIEYKFIFNYNYDREKLVILQQLG